MNRLLLLFLACFLTLSARAQFSFSLDRSEYEPGETITASWSGRDDATATDWIGIYPRNVTPGSVASTRWFYVNGTRTPGAALASGSVSFTNPGLSVREWSAFFLANDGYTIVGTADFSIVGNRDTVASFSLDKPIYRPGESITASWTNRSNPAGTDWVGIYPRDLVGVPDGNPGSTIWLYVNGTQSATSGLASGNVTFSSPALPEGSWRAYFLANDGYESLATFDFDVVASPILGFMPDHLFIEDGVPITLSWVISPPAEGIQSLVLSGGPSPVNVLSLDTIDVSPAASTLYTLTLNGSVSASTWVFNAASPSQAFSIPAPVNPEDQPVPISWNFPAATPDSWIGIWPDGSDPASTPPAFRLYLNGTDSPGDPVSVGAISFPLPVGSWFALLFPNDSSPPAFGPLRFNVASGPLPPLALREFGFVGSDLILRWDSQPSRSYEVRSSPDLSTWSTEATVPATSSSTSHFLKPLGPNRFYQIREKN